MYRTLVSMLCLALSWALSACTPQDQPPAPEQAAPQIAVAQVGGDSIFTVEVERLIALLGPGLKSKESGDAARRDYLQSLIDQKLLARAARAHGLDTVLTFKNKLAWKFREKVINTYQGVKISARIEISDEELEELFVAGDFQREKRLLRLLVKTRDEAMELRRQIATADDFASLARAHSLDLQSAEHGGDLGYVNRVGAANHGIPVQVFANLEPGSLTEILPLSKNYQLIFCTAERRADFAQYRRDLYKDVWKERFVAEHQALIEELATSLNLRLHSAGVAVLMAQDPAVEPYPTLAPKEGSAPLFIFDGGRITATHYIESFRRSGQVPALGDSLQIIRAAWKLPIPKTLVWHAAKEAGHTESPAMRYWKQRKTEEMLILALRQSEIGDKITITDAAVAQYYQDYREQFRTPVEMWLDELLVDDHDQAKALRQRLDRGETIADLASLSQRHGGPDGRGKIHLHSYQKGIYGALVDRALTAEIGALVGPIAVPGGYSIFRLKERSGGEIAPLKAVHKRIAAILRVIEQERRFNELVARYREEYADQVRIFEEAIPQIQLDPPAPSS